MNSAVEVRPIESRFQESVVDEWKLREYRETGSTNLVAAGLGAWNAVRADRQTAGRGRFQRSWVSDEGGLWLSAVVPVDAAGNARRTFPIAVGMAVCDALRALRIDNLRMRWPNDVLVGDRKLAGLLVDQFVPWLAVVGIGINVANLPEICDPTLTCRTARLADLLPNPPSVRELTALVLERLRAAVVELGAAGFQSLPPRVNALWGPPRRVELDLDGELRRGFFVGIDVQGRLLLADESNRRMTYDSWQVRHLQEVEVA